MDMERCPGCRRNFLRSDGPTHPYMVSSPACWARFGEILAREYSTPELQITHRLSVDAYAVQHPGGKDRRAIQSVGLHLARLAIQLQTPLPPNGANDVMLKLGRSKHTLRYLRRPESFSITVAQIPLRGSDDEHMDAVRRWASEAWRAWSAHHDDIHRWIEAADDAR